MNATIIGAGIGGLTAAIALRRIGIDAHIYERAPELREVGAGISIWANAIRALDHLGVGEAVRAIGDPMLRAEMRGQSGRTLMVGYNADDLERRLNVPVTVWMTHRAELVGALYAALPSNAVTFGRELQSAREESGRTIATFTDGSEIASDLLIGADGIHSAVRASLFGPQPTRYSGYTAWRGLCHIGENIVPCGYVAELWGRGARVGITRLSRGRVYWWATHNAPQGAHAGPTHADEHRHLTNYFAQWAHPVAAIIAATLPEAVLRNDIVDRQPHLPWHRGRIGLIGDAAHPTTPNLGQGGCMAIEDGVVLARHLQATSDVPIAWNNFERERFARTKAITNISHRLGWLGQRSSAPICAIRDWCFSLAPDTVAFRSILKWANYDTGPL